MKAVIQRVIKSSVEIDGETIGAIKKGLLILLGVENSDTIEDVDWLSNKILKMRIFNDENALMNVSVLDIKGELLIISQFTLHASTKKGNRPSFIKAAKPNIAIPLYGKFIAKMKESNLKIETGEFAADMKVNLINDGPVTIIIDSKNKE